jgi:hypothetical protein
MPEDIRDWGHVLDRWNTMDDDEGGEGADHGDAEAEEPTA